MMLLKVIGKFCTYVVLLIAGAVTGWILSPATSHESSPVAFHSGLTIERLSELSELLVVKLEVSDVLVSSIHGRTGGVEIVVLVKGDVSLGVDLGAARFDQVDKPHRIAVLTLPKPGPSRPRLDHARTRAVLIQKEGLWALSPGTGPYAALFDRAMSEAQGIVNSAGTTKDADDRARHHAEAVLQMFFRSLDWNVQITWADRS